MAELHNFIIGAVMLSLPYALLVSRFLIALMISSSLKLAESITVSVT